MYEEYYIFLCWRSAETSTHKVQSKRYKITALSEKKFE